MSCKTTRVRKAGKDHLDAYRKKAWQDKYQCRLVKGVGEYRRSSARCTTEDGEMRDD